MKSVDSTLHLTKAMGLVASSKIRRANEAMLKGREYAKAFSALVGLLTASQDCWQSAYLRTGGTRTRLIVIAGDRGMAGGYNANVFRLAREYPEAEILPLGRRACDRQGKEQVSSEHFSGEMAMEIAREQCRGFCAGEFDRLGILYTRYRSILIQQPEIRWILPLTRPETKSKADAIFEPDARTVLEQAVPAYVAGQLVAAVRESFASEVAARRMAMDSAGKNAQEMLDKLQLSYNRARQSAITQEITEIVAGSAER